MQALYEEYSQKLRDYFGDLASTSSSRSLGNSCQVRPT